MIVDEEFNSVTSANHVGAVRVPTISGSMTPQQLLGPANMVVRRNGWLYVYVSNEANQNVYFDNLVINHKRGPLVEQKDYYAFGLEIPGLSTEAFKPNYNQNRKTYNGIEHDTAFGLDAYEAFYRNLDPETGRWWQIDSKANFTESPYASMGNNPVLHSDPLGDTAKGVNQTSANRELAIIQNSFQGKPAAALRNLFRLKGATFKTINEKAFTKAISGLSSDQQSLAKGYKEVINSKVVHNIEVVKQSETLSDMGQKQTGFSTGKEINDNAGGGISNWLPGNDPNNDYQNQRYEAIVMDATTQVPAVDRSTGLPTTLAGSAGEISAHEILGHQLAEIHNSPGGSSLNAIQAGNLYLRAQGIKNIYRDEHVGVPFPPSKVEQIPTYLQ